jgi:hypothetical protein
MEKEETRLYLSVPNQGRDPVPEASIPKSCENGDAVKYPWATKPRLFGNAGYPTGSVAPYRPDLQPPGGASRGGSPCPRSKTS